MFKHKTEIENKGKTEELPPALSSPVSELKSENLKELIEKNIKWTQVVYEQNKQIKRRLTLLALGSYLRILIIVVPIILALIYLPPILRPLFEKYNSLLGGMGSVKTGAGSASLNGLLDNLSTSQIQDALRVLKQ